MEETIQIDGRYRPERWLSGEFQAVAYVYVEQGRKRERRIERKVAGKTMRGRFRPVFFLTEVVAQQQCDLLNK